jgi:hypothetical protein
MDARCRLLHNGQYGVIDEKTFREMVAERAYLKAEKRGFAHGHEEDDWLTAEQEISNQCRYWQQEYW